MRDRMQPDVWRAISELLRHHGFDARQRNRRDGARLSLKTAVTVTPIDDEYGRALPDQAFPGLTTNISAGGVGLAVARIPETKQVVISFWKDDNPWMHLLCEPRWVRFTTRGFHWIGCRIRAHLPQGFVDPPGPPEWTGPDVTVEFD